MEESGLWARLLILGTCGKMKYDQYISRSFTVQTDLNMITEQWVGFYLKHVQIRGLYFPPRSVVNVGSVRRLGPSQPSAGHLHGFLSAVMQPWTAAVWCRLLLNWASLQRIVWREASSISIIWKYSGWQWSWLNQVHFKVFSCKLNHTP